MTSVRKVLLLKKVVSYFHLKDAPIKKEVKKEKRKRVSPVLQNVEVI